MWMRLIVSGCQQGLLGNSLVLTICRFQAGTCSHLNMVAITPSASRAIRGQH